MTKNYVEQEEEIIKHLRSWLKSQDVFKKKKEIAKYLNTSHSHFNNIISKRRSPSKKLLEKIVVMTEYGSKQKKEVSLTKNDGRPYQGFTEEMRKWFSKQKRFKTQTALAKYLNKPISSVGMYFQGRNFPTGETRKILYELTKIEQLAPGDTTVQIRKTNRSIKRRIVSYDKNLDEISQATKIIEQELEELRKNINESKKSLQFNKFNQPSHIRFAKAFYNLADEILSFRESGVNARQMLRRLISAKDVGYVSSFLKALFDEDKFSDFILFSKYEFEMKGELDE